MAVDITDPKAREEAMQRYMNFQTEMMGDQTTNIAEGIENPPEGDDKESARHRAKNLMADIQTKTDQ